MNKENLTIAKVCIKFIIKQALLHFFILHAKRKAKTDARWLVEMISITHQGLIPR